MDRPRFQKLCLRIGQGDQTAMGELDHALRKKLRGSLIYNPRVKVPACDAEEIVNDTLFAVWSNLLGKYQLDKEFARDMSLAYIWRILLNKRANWVAQNMSAPNSVPDSIDGLEDESFKPLDLLLELEEFLQEEQNLEKMVQAIDELEEIERRVLQLRYFEHWDPGDIQIELGFLHPNYVNRHQNRAIGKIKKRLGLDEPKK